MAVVCLVLNGGRIVAICALLAGGGLSPLFLSLIRALAVGCSGQGREVLGPGWFAGLRGSSHWLGCLAGSGLLHLGFFITLRFFSFRRLLQMRLIRSNAVAIGSIGLQRGGINEKCHMIINHRLQRSGE